MRFSRFAVVSAVFATIFAVNTSAKTLYVATSGNDANTGAIDKPFKTLNKASRAVAPGDAPIRCHLSYFASVSCRPLHWTGVFPHRVRRLLGRKFPPNDRGVEHARVWGAGVRRRLPVAAPCVRFVR